MASNSDISLSDIYDLEPLRVRSTFPNYKLIKNGKVYGIKKYDNEKIEKASELFKSLALSEVYFLKKVQNRPNFPKFVTFLKDNKHIYLVTEWVESEILSEVLMKPVDPEMMLSIYKQIFLIATFLNKNMGITHGDLTPQNILLKKIEKRGSIKYHYMGKNYYFKNYGFLPVIWDFGVARTNTKPMKAYYRMHEILDHETMSENMIDTYKIVHFVRQDHKENMWLYMFCRHMWLEYTNNGIEAILQDSTTVLEQNNVNIQLT